MVVDDVLRLGVVEAEFSVDRLEAVPARLEEVPQSLGVLLALLELRQNRPAKFEAVMSPLTPARAR